VKNLHRCLLPLILIVMMVLLAVGGTYAYFDFKILGGAIKTTMASVSGDVAADIKVVGPDGIILPNSSYSVDVNFQNTGTAGVHVRAYVICVWETPEGKQVPLPGKLVTVSLEDEQDGWHWPVAGENWPQPGVGWERLPVDDEAPEDFLPSGESATVIINLQTARQAIGNAAYFEQIQQKKLNLRVKVYLEMIGDGIYHQGG
jgi:hypothetical protein